MVKRALASLFTSFLAMNVDDEEQVEKINKNRNEQSV